MCFKLTHIFKLQKNNIFNELEFHNKILVKLILFKSLLKRPKVFFCLLGVLENNVSINII
jgi:hypothetical protein